MWTYFGPHFKSQNVDHPELVHILKTKSQIGKSHFVALLLLKCGCTLVHILKVQSDFCLLKCGPAWVGPHFKSQKSDWKNSPGDLWMQAGTLVWESLQNCASATAWARIRPTMGNPDVSMVSCPASCSAAGRQNLCPAGSCRCRRC